LVPTGVVTLISTGPVPAGETAVIEDSEFTVKLAAFVEPNLTAVAPVKLVPAIVTDVPPAAGPLFGSTLVIVGRLSRVPTARPKVAPAEIVLTFARPATATGASLSVVVPSPSCPELLAPQEETVPSLRKARLYSQPAETAFTSVRPLTGTGVRAQAPSLHVSGPVVVPSPSWPARFWPHAITVPFLRTARLWPLAVQAQPRPAIAVTSLRPLTGTRVLLQGTFLPPVSQVSGPLLIPSPSCPRAMSPQAITVPFLRRARLWKAPAAIAATSLRPLTGTGTSLKAVVPLPTCPYSLAPRP
jgi:hypothetical protein